MTKYWIRENDEQSGPFTLEELESRTFAKGSTFVWHKGLEGWMHIENVPELAHLIATELPEAAEEPVAVENEAEAAEENAVEPEPEPEVSTPTPPTPPSFNPIPTPPPYMNQPEVAVPAQEPKPECPPTNLVAAIVCTMLCCQPFGVAGIVFAVLTKNNYNMGNYEKARKYSACSDWMCILSVVLFFLTLPFTILFM